MKLMWSKVIDGGVTCDHIVIFWRGLPIYKSWRKDGRKIQSSMIFNDGWPDAYIY